MWPEPLVHFIFQVLSKSVSAVDARSMWNSLERGILPHLYSVGGLVRREWLTGQLTGCAALVEQQVPRLLAESRY